jgi:hypothetical protein
MTALLSDASAFNTVCRQPRYGVGNYVLYEGSIEEFRGHCAFVVDTTTNGSEERYTLSNGLRNVRAQSVSHVAINMETHEKGERIRAAYLARKH